LPEARHVERIAYDEMLELASLGAGVMHNRSIEFAKKFGTAIHVRSSFSDSPGSMIVAEPEFADRAVCGAAVIKNEARVSVLGIPDRPGVSLQIFSAIAAKSVNVDMIVQNVGEKGLADISFTVPKNELVVTLESVQQAVNQLGSGTLSHDDNVSKVSVVGLGMAKQSGVAETMFSALAAENVNIQMITTSEIKISVLVDRDAAPNALRGVHRAFELDKPSPGGVTPLTAEHAKADAADVASRLHGANMEELFIDDISLDETQGRVTINGVPDVPGIAARVFREIAAGGVFVDMIVQSHGSHADRASLSFTVPRGQVDKATDVAKRLVKQLACKDVNSCPNIAKLSVSGVGLRSHTGVAIRMFRALAEAGVNVDMVSTSEVRVNVVVDGRDGDKALESLRAAFADALG
jgi:aspartate kinase